MLQYSSEFNKETYKRNKIKFIKRVTYSRLSRCCAARGSNMRFSFVCPTKVMVCKSFMFT